MHPGGRFTEGASNGIVCGMYELRVLRRSIGLGRREFAALFPKEFADSLDLKDRSANTNRKK
jgi:hypothetical protein